MRRKLREEFMKRAQTDFTDDLDHKLIIGTAEDIVRELCDEIGWRLLKVCEKLKRIEGLAEIDAIRNTLEKFVEDLWENTAETE